MIGKQREFRFRCGPVHEARARPDKLQSISPAFSIIGKGRYDHQRQQSIGLQLAPREYMENQSRRRAPIDPTNWC